MSAFLSALSQARDETTAGVMILSGCVVYAFSHVLTHGYQSSKASVCDLLRVSPGTGGRR